MTEIARLLQEHDQLPALVIHLKSAIARRDLGADALIWVCRERKGAAVDVFGGDVGASILNLLENDHLSDGPRKTSRLQSLLADDKNLLAMEVALGELAPRIVKARSGSESIEVGCLRVADDDRAGG